MQLPFKENKKIFGEGRNWIILVFSLLLAFFMWSVMKLSRTYSAYIRYHVEVVSNIPGRANQAVSADELVIGAKSNGFNILQNTRNSGKNILYLNNIEPKYFHKCSSEGDDFYFLPDDLHQAIQDALGADIRIESFATDTLYFNFPLQANKKVPVNVHSAITYLDQFMPMSKMVIRPDSVLIYGDEAVISQINAVNTKTINVNDAKRSLNGVVSLNPIEGVRLSADEVFYNMEIGRFVENTVKVPVIIVDAPSYANVAVIPPEITIKYRQPFGSAAKISAQDFTVGINYDDVLQHDVLKPQIVKSPDNILDAVMSPKFVECIL